jgi:hypothetical protein
MENEILTQPTNKNNAPEPLTYQYGICVPTQLFPTLSIQQTHEPHLTHLSVLKKQILKCPLSPSLFRRKVIPPLNGSKSFKLQISIREPVFKSDSTGLAFYPDSKIERNAHVISIMASLLPTASIFTLYFVHSLLLRLVAIMGLSILFSMCLAIFTNARMIEIFGATAAFGSVQVVFVGSTSWAKVDIAVTLGSV